MLCVCRHIGRAVPPLAPSLPPPPSALHPHLALLPSFLPSLISFPPAPRLAPQLFLSPSLQGLTVTEANVLA